MATMAGACCLPSAAFSRTLDESCSSSSGSVFATFQTPQAVTGMCRSLKQLGLVGRGRGWLGGSSALKASSVFNSASSSFQGRICLFLTCPVGFASGEAREGRRVGVQASLLGVGAPEALVIGVVALLVFGPKGLAEVARTLGKSLRAFQPTIKELQQVSNEFKATLEQEIGLDEMRNPSSYDYPPTSTPSRPSSDSSIRISIPPTLSATEAPKSEEASVQAQPYVADDYVRIKEDQANTLVTEEQRKASEAAAWGGSRPVKPAAEDSTGDQVQTPAKSFFNDNGPVQAGSTPSKPLERPIDNDSQKS
ncbi:sec-independent protein translocase protein TATB, chloroplastic [Physcomitrium patens]|uniref:sec-independent protein translocase protein TATB, chloroplastic n=1 Tax=Physcomitrium patens TaxID=3218 RepID=UPI000162296C|nr:sec-independent protein translocase protein TATB, chloroplastic-like [Physcomitrium patens]|eukprot:XP_024376998.1 sec-independent protein translocase protein TATB, chloroplastic-like [Physcomitrella patens]